MSINNGQKIIRLQVITKFNSILNKIRVTYETSYRSHITNVPTDYTFKTVSSPISTKKSVSTSINIILEQISNNSINAKNLLSNVQTAMKHLSRLRYTICRSYRGLYANGKAHGWASSFVSDGIGAFTNIKNNQTFTKQATDKVKQKISANKKIIAKDIIQYFNQLIDNYVYWKDHNTNQYIEIYYCHSNCHSSCHARSRR